MNPVLKECIDVICLERDKKWSESFVSVDKLISEFGESNLSDKIFENTPRTVPFEVIADILNICIWSTSDNGTKIQQVAEDWLRERKDSRKMRIALSLDILPFKTQSEARNVLTELPDELRAVDSYAIQMLDAWEKHEKD